MRTVVALVSLAFVALPPPALGAERVVDIRDCGAVGDGKTPCTAAIRKAIDQCKAAGGGTVRLPAGTWLTGTVYLESNVTLSLEKGCTLLGSRHREDYAGPRAAPAPGARPSEFRAAAILAGADLQNVAIRGEGTIDGQGDAFREPKKLRPKNIYLERCRNVTIEGVRLRSAGCWMQHYRHCDSLAIRKIDVFNHVSYNNDGLNVDSCRNVLIEDCRVDSDDDAIVLKSLSTDPCRGVTIRNCTVSSHCNAIKMGTESGGGFQEITVSGCTIHSPRDSKKIYGAQRGLAGIALEIVDGGTLSNVTVEKVRIDGVTVPVFLRLGDRARRYGEKSSRRLSQNPDRRPSELVAPNGSGIGSKPDVGSFQNVVLRDITAENASEIGCSISGLPGHPIRNVVLENLKLGFDGGGTRESASRAVPEKPESYPESTMFGTLPAYGFYCRHVEGLTLRKVELRTRQTDLRHAVVFDDVKRLEIDSLAAGFARGAAATLRLTQVDGAVIRGCKAPAGAEPFLLLEGDKSRQIVLRQNDLSGAAKAVAFGPGASAPSVSSDR